MTMEFTLLFKNLLTIYITTFYYIITNLCYVRGNFFIYLHFTTVAQATFFTTLPIL